MDNIKKLAHYIEQTSESKEEVEFIIRFLELCLLGIGVGENGAGFHTS